MPDVVVLLPGILGSVLQKDGHDVWALSGGAMVRGLLSLGDSIRALALTDDPWEEDDLGDGITASRLIPDVHLVPGLWKIDGYSRIANSIRSNFSVRPGENYFEFPYDWRRDNRNAARRLAASSAQWLRAWRESSGNAGARLVLVAHSMGGLAARYFLEVLDGWRDTRALVTFGTPYRGSLNALGFLANGFEKKLGPFTLVDLSDLLRSLTSVYQLLPIYPCHDGGDGTLRRVAEADIPHVDPSRSAAALAFHRDIEAAVNGHLEADDYQRDRYRIHPVVGTFQPTLQSSRQAGDRLELLFGYEGSDLDGDGTVPRVSATPIELSEERREVFACERHASLQNSDPVLVQLAGILSGLDLDLSQFRGRVAARVAMSVEDAYATDEPVVVRARPEEEGVALRAVVAEVDTGIAVTAPMAPGEDGWHEAQVPPFPAGTYRVTVAGADDAARVEDVTDVFVVA